MRTPSILVVDDDQVIRDLIVETFTPAGYAVDTAISGRDAIRSITQRWPDLILLDLLMPDGHGTVVVNMLRALHRSIPIVVISSVPDAVEWAQEIGAAAFLDKPFDLADLLAVVGQVFGV